MASKSSQHIEISNDDIEELLDTADKALDRVKVLYEQYFLGIQKQPPTHLHTDIERKLRELSQVQIRNTALRYRFAMMQQKFGSYHSYWRRTLRQIENGTYTRNLQKIGRQAARSGEEIPEEILAAMPKRMREQVKRDREAALALARLRSVSGETGEADAMQLVEGPPPAEQPARPRTRTGGAHRLTEADADFDMDAFFAEVQAGTIPPPMGTVASRAGAQATPTFKQPAPVAPAQIPTTHPPKPTAAPPPPARSTASLPAIPSTRPTGGIPPIPRPVTPATTQPKDDAKPFVPPLAASAPRPPATSTTRPAPPPLPPVKKITGAIPPIPRPVSTTAAPSQITRPNPIVPGAASRIQPVGVETMAGPFPREVGAPEPANPTTIPTRTATPVAGVRIATPPAGVRVATPVAGVPRTQAMPRVGEAGKQDGAIKPPAGMSDADVNALYAKYVKAKELVGESTGPGSYTKLLKTINQQAPKIMEQYNAKGVDFSVVVKDNQVIIRAKPKP